MKYENLHTRTLERLFGPIKTQIIRQEENIRIVHLRDKRGVSRTLGIVRFLNVDGKSLKVAHDKILAGGLLGKTLHDSAIDYDKEFIGALQVSLPIWLKKDFKTEQDSCEAFYSKISIYGGSLLNNKILYSELIEIIPPDLSYLFPDKMKPLFKIDKSLFSLFKTADLTQIKLKEVL